MNCFLIGTRRAKQTKSIPHNDTCRTVPHAFSYHNTSPDRHHIHGGLVECDAADRESHAKPRFNAKAKKGVTEEHVQNSTSQCSNAHDNGIAVHNLPLGQNAARKEQQGQSSLPGCND